MIIKLLKFQLLAVLVFFSVNASGQQHNFGLYVKVSVEGNEAIYERVWSRYEPGILNEPILPTDIPYVPPTLPDCDPITGICDELQGSYGLTGGGSVDRIRVVCGSLCNQMSNFIFRFAFLVQGGGGSGSDFEGENFLREALESHFEGMCNDADFDINTPLTDEQRQAIFNFLNSPNAQMLWDASNYDAMIFDRLEQAGWLLPDGSFIPATSTSNSYCDAEFEVPSDLPVGTIVVHTHPVKRLDDISTCDPANPFYLNRPSTFDHSELALIAGVDIGLILDADGFIIYTASDNGQFFEDACGFERTGQ